MRNWVIGLFVVALLVGVFITFRFKSEDSWICAEGKWVKHGNPSIPPPIEPCETVKTTPISQPDNSNSVGVNRNELTPESSDNQNGTLTTVAVYFPNSRKSVDRTDCAEVFAAERKISSSTNPLTTALEELLAGPTLEERKEGFSSLFSEKTKGMLISMQVKDRTAYVNFKDLRTIIPNASTSCGSSDFLAETGNTLKQFKTVDKIIYAIEGNPETFYEWLQFGCSAENNNCDPSPFK